MLGFSIPKDKNYPSTAVQCHSCGGNGCAECEERGWYPYPYHPKGRRCANKACNRPLNPSHVAVYCTNLCAAREDA